MTFRSDHTQAVTWLDGLDARLHAFERDAFFEMTSTSDRKWWAQTIENNTQTQSQIITLLEQSIVQQNGCLEPEAKGVKRVSIRGRQIYAYQLIYWAGNALIPSKGEVVRHQCDNRRCINPEHLQHGDQRENLQDRKERQS